MEHIPEKQKLIEEIEEARTRLNDSIEAKMDFDTVYKISLELDRLIEQYIVAGY